MLSALFALLPLLASAAPLQPLRPRQSSGYLLKSARDGSCMSLPANTSPSNGVQMVTVDCGSASTWDITADQTQSIVLHGTNYAIDIGLNPTNNGIVKIWQSYPGAPQQTWNYNDQTAISNPNSGQCIDNGGPGTGLQTYQCYVGNTNQEWALVAPGSSSGGGGGGSGTGTGGSGGGSSGSTPSGFTYIKATNVASGNCLTVQNGYAAINTQVELGGCMVGQDGSIAALSGWLLPAAGTSGPIRTYGGGSYEQGVNSYTSSQGYLCLDAGNNPGNGSGLKLYTCYDGLLQQTWTVNNDGTISLANGQCMDVEKETIGETSTTKPYGPDAQMQTWQCSNNGDPYQQFYFSTSQ